MSCSLSRSQSCCSLSRSVLEAESRVDDHRGLLPPPSSDFITRSVDEISGEVGIKRHFHEHPLVLSTYLKVDENVDEFNFCCFCNKIYFTVGEPIYTCFLCYMCMHQSCGELPLWVHSTRHPQHPLWLTVSTTYADCVDGRRGKERILTTAAYECAICHYSVGIKEALQCISISLFKNTYLNRTTTPSSPTLRLNEITGLSSSSIKVVSRELVHFYHAHPLILSMYEVHEENERCQLCRCYFTKVETIYSCKACNFSLHKSCAGLPEFIKSTLHPDHLLMFKPPVVEGTIHCDGCCKFIDQSPRYTCQLCYFKLHYQCALDSYLKYSPLGKNRFIPTLQKATTTPYLSRSLSFPMEDKRKSQIIFSEPPPTKDSRGISLTLSSFFNFQFAENATDQIRHFSHEHPLVFTVFKMEYRSPLSGCNGICPFCNDTIHPDDPIYGCHECQLFLHESCAKMPETMRSTWHPAHMLRFMQNIYPYCQLCDKELFNSWNFRYGCDECAIDFHCGCASAYSFEDHKAQEHTFHFVKASIFTCDACGITETKECISCVCTSCPMQIHKRCSNPFPRTVKQNWHHHKLNLTYFFEVDFDYANETCKLCFNPMNKVYCLYQCHGCSYIAHVTCAASKYIEYESVEEESVANELQESVPRTVKQNRHHHELNLTYSFEVDFDYAKETCKICFNQMNTVYCMYQCSDCNYIAHVTCATKDIVEDESVANELQEFVTTEDAEGNQVEHFSHAHPLIFTKEMPTKIDAYCDAEDLIFTEEEEPTKIEAFCDACVSPISAPFYACATDDQCNFYLHKRCFELPLEIQHPLHVHRLTLKSMEVFFFCYGCGFLCNGFRYSCDDCKIYLDVRCSLLSDTLKHDGHDCTLTLIDYKRVRGEGTAAANHHKCSVCDGSSVSSFRFSCKRCNFHLDLGCASLPKSVTHECPKHDWKAHPLQLTYGGIPDASGIYFCDMCEESRVLSHWFYDCEDCVWSNHPHCVLGRFQFKYGKTYKLKGHDHKVQLVKKAPSRYDPISCCRCDEPLTHDSPLFCSTCNLYFHIFFAGAITGYPTGGAVF